MGIVLRFKEFRDKISHQIKLYSIRNNNNIILSDNNKIYPNVNFETNFGGCIKIGTGNEFLHGVCIMTYGGKITIGNNCSINPYTIIYGHGKGVQIGNNVLIAGHCMIIPSNHDFSNYRIPINQQGIISKGIIINDDVWLGAGVKILDGVTIGSGSIIGAGSVVNKDIEPYTIYAGIPAKKIKKRK